MRLPLPARLGGLAAVLCADRFHVHADNASYRARLSLLADRARLEEAVSLRASSLHAAVTSSSSLSGDHRSNANGGPIALLQSGVTTLAREQKNREQMNKKADPLHRTLQQLPHHQPPAPGVAVLPPTYYKLGPGKTCPFANPPATLNSAEECQFAATRLGVNRDAGAVQKDGIKIPDLLPKGCLVYNTQFAVADADQPPAKNKQRVLWNEGGGETGNPEVSVLCKTRSLSQVTSLLSESAVPMNLLSHMLFGHMILSCPDKRRILSDYELSLGVQKAVKAFLLRSILAEKFDSPAVQQALADPANLHLEVVLDRLANDEAAAAAALAANATAAKTDAENGWNTGAALASGAAYAPGGGNAGSSSGLLAKKLTFSAVQLETALSRGGEELRGWEWDHKRLKEPAGVGAEKVVRRLGDGLRFTETSKLHLTSFFAHGDDAAGGRTTSSSGEGEGRDESKADKLKTADSSASMGNTNTSPAATAESELPSPTASAAVEPPSSARRSTAAGNSLRPPRSEPASDSERPEKPPGMKTKMKTREEDGNVFEKLNAAASSASEEKAFAQGLVAGGRRTEVQRPEQVLLLQQRKQRKTETALISTCIIAGKSCLSVSFAIAAPYKEVALTYGERLAKLAVGYNAAVKEGFESALREQNVLPPEQYNFETIDAQVVETDEPTGVRSVESDLRAVTDPEVFDPVALGGGGSNSKFFLAPGVADDSQVNQGAGGVGGSASLLQKDEGGAQGGGDLRRLLKKVYGDERGARVRVRAAGEE